MNRIVLTAVLCLSIWGCHSGNHGHSHGDNTPTHASQDHGHGHDHGHGGGSTAITLWDDHMELFAEYPAFIVGQAAPMITHLTYLEKWSPRTSGEIDLTLTAPGQAAIQMRDPNPARDGIYLPNLNFPAPGKWRIDIRVPHPDGPTNFTINDVQVFASQHDADHAATEAEDDGSVSFLKEQQWRIDFATRALSEHRFRESLVAYGEITPRSGGQVAIHAPIHGRIGPDDAPLQIGQRVERGQRLTAMTPFLEALEDPITLREALRRVELKYELAVKEMARTERLIAQDIIPEDDLDHRQLEVQSRKNEMEAATRRLAQLEGSDAAINAVPLYAPLSGVITAVHASPGALFEEGEALYEITDLSTVQLEVQIPESQIDRIVQAEGAWFTVEGQNRVFEVGPQAGGRRIALSGKVDPHRRTVPLLFEVPNPNESLRIGMFTRARVLTGKAAAGVAMPASALVEEAGIPVAYVQAGGESFQRRPLRLGIREGNLIQVISGLQAGERVVTRGAYQVRLAAAVGETPDHGHSH